MDNLHFIPNNIFTKIFKELIKYKNNYQQYLNYIYIGIVGPRSGAQAQQVGGSGPRSPKQ